MMHHNKQTLTDVRATLDETTYQVTTLGGDPSEMAGYRAAVLNIESRLNELANERNQVGDMRREGAKGKLQEIGAKITETEAELEALLGQVAVAEKKVCTDAFLERGKRCEELTSSIREHEQVAAEHLLKFHKALYQAHEQKKILHLFFKNARRVAKQQGLPEEVRTVETSWGSRWTADYPEYMGQWLEKFRKKLANHNYPAKGNPLAWLIER